MVLKFQNLVYLHTGTTLIATFRLGRNCLAIEKDGLQFIQAKTRFVKGAQLDLEEITDSDEQTVEQSEMQEMETQCDDEHDEH